MLYILNVYNITCQLYLNKAGKIKHISLGEKNKEIDITKRTRIEILELKDTVMKINYYFKTTFQQAEREK